MRTEQISVKCGGWRGRVHCTLARDPIDDITTTSSPSVFSNVSVGDVLQARVVRVQEREGSRYVCMCVSVQARGVRVQEREGSRYVCMCVSVQARGVRVHEREGSRYVFMCVSKQGRWGTRYVCV